MFQQLRIKVGEDEIALKNFPVIPVKGTAFRIDGKVYELTTSATVVEIKIIHGFKRYELHAFGEEIPTNQAVFIEE